MIDSSISFFTPIELTIIRSVEKTLNRTQAELTLKL
jgi:hypothetical protein